MSGSIVQDRQARESAIDQVAGLTRGEDVSQGELAAALRTLVSRDNMTLKADLNDFQVGAVAKALAFASKYNIPELINRVNLFLECTVSKKRMGRFEYVDAVKSGGGMMASEEVIAEPNALSRILGR